jgi:hypothetical protein
MKPSYSYYEIAYLIDIADSRRMLGVISAVVEQEKSRYTRQELHQIRKMNFSRVSELT